MSKLGFAEKFSGKLTFTITLAILVFTAPWSVGAEFTVYQVFRAVDLGESDRPPPKDIFINMGSGQGLKKGTLLDVYRKISSFDNLTEKLAADHVVPVGRIKIIHTDEKTAIARLDRFVSIDQEPATLPQAIMIGDLVRRTEKN